MKAYTVCARAQSSIFMVIWPFSPIKHCKIVEEVWPMTEQVVKSKDLRRQTKERMAVFSQTVWEILSKKLYKYMRNNSTKQKVKKILTSHYWSKFRAQRYGNKLKRLEDKKAVHTSRKHDVRRICQLYTKGGPADKLRWCEPPRDHLDYRRRDNIQRSSP